MSNMDRMKNINISVICILLLIISSDFLDALTIKLGSLVPAGSPWDISLKHIAAEWKKISKGEVSLKIYPGGIAGDESDMIRKMRIGQLHAAAVTVVGLSHIFPGVTAIALPLLINSEKELNYVLNKMQPYYEQEMDKKGFKMLLWSNAGWTHFFSREPVIRPDDLKKQKLFVWEGDGYQIKTWTELGFHPVPLAATEIMISLQSGMIDAFTTSPLVAASYQWFGIAPHMCEMELSPLLGGIVISKRVWEKVSSDWRPQFKKVLGKIGKNMRKHAFESENEAIIVMKKHGLKIHPVPENIKKEWKITLDKGLEKLVGNSIHKESYEKVKKYIAEYRKKKAK